MDLHVVGPAATPEERAAIDGVLDPVIGAPRSGWAGGTRDPAVDGHVAHGGHEARERRDLLLPALEAAAGRIGWVSRGALNHVSKRLAVPPAEAYGVASFYALLPTTPRPPIVAHVCDDIACRLAGAERICEDLERRHGPAGSATADGAATWMRSPCLGQCERAPAVMVTSAGPQPTTHVRGDLYGGDDVLSMLETARVSPDMNIDVADYGDLAPQAGDPSLRLLTRVGRVDPRSLDAYREDGGYEALRAALKMGAAAVIEEVTASKLVGRGGAAFPTGRKWAAVAQQPATPRYLVCNADESEPGTFKDRVILEHDPFALVESMTIAGYAIGASRGYLYLRGEYPLARRRLAAAIDQARRADLLGSNVAGSGWSYDIELRIGAGAYIAGEETALFESIEGGRPEPRNKPPFPVEIGLFGKPTAVNNVETLVNVPLILRNGGRAYATIGTEGSTGPKLFCVSGHVERPGVYETDFGSTLGDLIQLAGGVKGDRRIQAILLGGAAGAFVGRDRLGTKLTFEGTRAAGATLGSGVVMVFDETADLPGALRRIAAFFRDESCGQCVPCRVGTVRQEELLARLAAGRPLGSLDTELALFDDLARAMRDASICGLGQTASSAIESAIKGGLVHFDAIAGRRVMDPDISRIYTELPARPSRVPEAPPAPEVPTVELSIDGAPVAVPAGSTILEAARSVGIDTPTLCYLENLTPVNVCRVCVVEVTGSRVLVPACSRRVEAGMEVQTDSERVRHSRRLVLELLGSSVDLSLAGPAEPDGDLARYGTQYGADATRFGRPAAPAAAGERDAREPGHHHDPSVSASHPATAETVAQPVKVDNDLYVRDYSRCILCYKCVEACGEDAQNTFAIAVAGRGFDARISTEFDVALPESACVYCGNCIGVCPTGALMFKSEFDMREAGTWAPEEQTVTDTICPYCGVGCTLSLHVQDNRIVKVTSPSDSSVTEGHLCVKGRFGYEFVQVLPKGTPRPE